MPASIADLGLRIDSSPAVAATKALNEMAPAATRAESATEALLKVIATSNVEIRDQITALSSLGKQQTDTSQKTKDHTAALESMRQRFNPIYAASKQYEQVLGQIAKAQQLGAISALEAEAAIEREAQAFAIATPATNALAHAHGGLSAQGQAALHSIRSMAESLALGIPPTMALTQQMNHLTFAASNEKGGLGGSFKEASGVLGGLASSVLAFLGPIGLATIAIGAFSARQIQVTSAHVAELNAIQAQISGITDFSKHLDDLNQKYGFLDAAERQRIVTMDQTGQHNEAVRAAMNDINIALDEQKDHVGGLEGAWLRLNDAIFGGKTLVHVKFSAEEMRQQANEQIKGLSLWADQQARSTDTGNIQDLLSSDANYKKLADNHFSTQKDVFGFGGAVMTNDQAAQAVRNWNQVDNALKSLKSDQGDLVVQGQRYLSQQQIQQQLLKDAIALDDAKAAKDKDAVKRITEDQARLESAGKLMTQSDRQAEITLKSAKAYDDESRQVDKSTASLDKHNAALAKHNALMAKQQFDAELRGLRGIGRNAFLAGDRGSIGVSEEDAKVLKDINGPLDDYLKKMQALDRLQKAHQISGAQHDQFAGQAELGFRQTLEPTTFGGGLENQMRIMQLSSGNAFGKLGKQVSDIFGPDGTLISGLSDATARSLIFGDSFSGAVKNIGLTIASDLISQMIKIGLTQAENAVLGDSLAATSAAETAAIAAATSAAWATPAALASLASFGTNAAPASAAIAGTVATSNALAALSTALPGFANGVVGINGPGTGTSDNILALLSRDESITTASGTRGNESTLRAMNAGMKFDGAGSPTMNVVVEQHPGVGVDVSQDLDGRMRIIARQEVSSHAPTVVAASVHNANSAMSKTLRQYQGKRQRV